jgi:hypothetical protein
MPVSFDLISIGTFVRELVQDPSGRTLYDIMTDPQHSKKWAQPNIEPRSRRGKLLIDHSKTRIGLVPPKFNSRRRLRLKQKGIVPMPSVHRRNLVLSNCLNVDGSSSVQINTCNF